MIRLYKTDMLGELIQMLCCDHCGECMALNTDDVSAMDLFHCEHEECTKPQNDNLDFLQEAEQYV